MEKISDVLNRLSKGLLVMILTGMCVVIFLQVIFRYLIHLPLFWTEEFGRYCLVWASLLGAAIALKGGEHIAITLIMDRIPGKARMAFAHVSRISIALILLVIMIGGIKLVQVTLTQISPALRVPMAVPYLAIPVSSAIMLFHIIASMFPHGNGGETENP